MTNGNGNSKSSGVRRLKQYHKGKGRKKLKIRGISGGKRMKK